MASTVQEILSLDLPDPVWSYKPTRAAPIRSDMSFSRGTDRRVLDPAAATYKTRGVDTPRIMRGGGVRLRGRSLTNKIDHSADISLWANATVGTGVASIVDGETAYPLTSGTTNVKSNAGVTAGGRVALSFIVEESTANKVRLGLKDTTYTASTVTYWDLDFSTGEVTLVESGGYNNQDEYLENNAKILRRGSTGDIYEVRLYAEETSSGNGQQIWVQGDPTGNGGETIFHHAQLIPESSGSPSPIVTGSSSVSKGADALNVDGIGSNIDGKQGTIYVEYRNTWINNIGDKNQPFMRAFGPEIDFLHMDYTNSPAGFGRGALSIAPDEGVDGASNNKQMFRERTRVALSWNQTEAAIGVNGATTTDSTGADLTATTGINFSRLHDEYVLYRASWRNEYLPPSALSAMTSLSI